MIGWIRNNLKNLKLVYKFSPSVFDKETVKLKTARQILKNLVVAVTRVFSFTNQYFDWGD